MLSGIDDRMVLFIPFVQLIFSQFMIVPTDWVGKLKLKY